jgi:hypothetical protein
MNLVADTLMQVASFAMVAERPGDGSRGFQAMEPEPSERIVAERRLTDSSAIVVQASRRDTTSLSFSPSVETHGYHHNLGSAKQSEKLRKLSYWK